MSVSSGIQANSMAGPERNDLSERIAKAQADRSAREAKKAKREAERENMNSGAGLALRYGAEMAGSIVIGLLIGYWFDKFFGTDPWGLLVWLGFGLAAGILSVIRAYRQLTAHGNLQEADQSDGPENGT